MTLVTFKIWFLAGAVFVGCRAKERADSEAAAPAPSESASTARDAAADAVGDDVAFASLRSAGTIGEAVAAAKGIHGTASARALALGHWSRSHVKWDDLLVKTPETSFALALKDPDEAAGKRFCVAARVDYLRALSGEPKIYAAQVTTNQGHYVLITPRSTGKIVDAENARFCAFVAGVTESEPGGVGYSLVNVVGMFDLPENKTQP